MFVEERQADIFEKLKKYGKVLVKELSVEYGVSSDLIRKDLNALEKKGYCKKVYGGACLIRKNVHRENASSRYDIDMETKQSLAKLAYSLIQPGYTIFLDISTTNIELAKLLVLDPIDITVVTNMLDVVCVLKQSNMRVIFIGGEFDHGHDGFVGNLADSMIASFHFDLSFMGVVGVDIENNRVMTYMPNDGMTKKIVLSHTKYAYMLCEASKLYQSGNFEYAHIHDFYGMITDSNLDSDEIKIIKNNKKQ